MQSELFFLKQLYIFRYLTQRQMVEILELSGNAHVSRILSSLESKGLVEKLKGKSVAEPAIYSLSPTAAKTLKLHSKELELDLPLARSITNPRSTTLEFKQHCMAIADIYIQLKRLTKGKDQLLGWLSKTQLYGFEPLPKPAPDALITLSRGNEFDYYFLEVLPSNMPGKGIFKRLHQYRSFWNSAEWDVEVGSDSPKCLIVAQNFKQKVQTEKLATAVDEDNADCYIVQLTANLD